MPMGGASYRSKRRLFRAVQHLAVCGRSRYIRGFCGVSTLAALVPVTDRRGTSRPIHGGEAHRPCRLHKGAFAGFASFRDAKFAIVGDPGDEKGVVMADFEDVVFVTYV